MEMRIIRWEGPLAPEEGRLKEQLVSEGYEVFKWADSAGTKYGDHHHDRHESIWVVEGMIEFDIRGEKLRLGPGDRLFLPSGTEHTSVVPGPENCFYLVGQKE